MLLKQEMLFLKAVTVTHSPFSVYFQTALTESLSERTLWRATSGTKKHSHASESFTKAPSLILCDSSFTLRDYLHREGYVFSTVRLLDGFIVSKMTQKTTERIPMELGRRTGRGTKKDPFKFDGDPEFLWLGADQNIIQIYFNSCFMRGRWWRDALYLTF